MCYAERVLIMIKFKQGVRLHPKMFQDYRIARIVWVAQSEAPDGYDVTITSGCEGKHCKNSAHYSGKAIDLRTRDVPADPQVWANRIQQALGSNYFVLLESDHIHVQANI